MKTLNVLTGSACVVTLVIGLAGCSAAPRQRPIKGGPVDTGAGTLTAARKYLEGRWALESFRIFEPGKATPVDIKAEGTVSYDEYSNLTMDVRGDASAVAALKAAGVPATNTGFSSSGRVVVDMTKRTLTYMISKDGSVAAPTGPLALNRPRFWEVAQDLLTLTTKDDAGKPLMVSTWRRMPD
jgi:hypothetical protein